MLRGLGFRAFFLGLVFVDIPGRIEGFGFRCAAEWDDVCGRGGPPGVLHTSECCGNFGLSDAAELCLSG